MGSMVRKLMRSVRRNAGRMQASVPAQTFGTVRAGMHQAAEQAYLRSRLAESAAAEEEKEEMPAVTGSEIPPDDADGGEIIEEIASGEEVIVPDDEILAEIADPEASENEEAESGKEIFGSRIKEQGARASMSVDWSGETVPVLGPVTGGIGAAPETELVYDSGDAAVREIIYPAPVKAETVRPFVPEAEDPSANVAAAPEGAE